MLPSEASSLYPKPHSVRLAAGQDAATTMYVTWGTDSPGTQSVQYRLPGGTTTTRTASASAFPPAQDCVMLNDPETGNQTHTACVVYPGSGFVHSALLTSLASGSLYEYRVGSGPDSSLTWTPWRTFRTAPTAFAGNVTFVAYGDTASATIAGVSPSPGARNALNASLVEPAFHLQLGDISYADEQPRDHVAIWKEWFAEQSPLLTRGAYMWALGNHEFDYGPDHLGYLSTLLPQADLADLPVWSYRWGDIVIVSVWSNTEGDDRRTPPHLLDAELGRADYADAKWRIVTMHSGLYATSYEYTNSTGVLTVSGHGSNCRTRDDYAAILARHGVDVVLAGHDHNFQRSYPVDLATGAVVVPADPGSYAKGLGLTSIVAGASGKVTPAEGVSAVPAATEDGCDVLAAQQTLQNRYSHLVVRETAEALSFEMRAADGTVIDAFSIVG